MRNNKRIKKVMSEMIRMAKKVYPSVAYAMYPGGYAGVDATIKFFAPVKYEDKLDRVLRERAWQALLEENIFIAPLTLSKKSNSSTSAR